MSDYLGREKNIPVLALYRKELEKRFLLMISSIKARSISGGKLACGYSF